MRLLQVRNFPTCPAASSLNFLPLARYGSGLCAMRRRAVGMKCLSRPTFRCPSQWQGMGRRLDATRAVELWLAGELRRWWDERLVPVSPMSFPKESSPR